MGGASANIPMAMARSSAALWSKTVRNNSFNHPLFIEIETELVSAQESKPMSASERAGETSSAEETNE